MSSLIAFLLANKEVFLSVFGMFAALTFSKFPDPRKYEDEWYYAPYYAFFTIATTYLSVGSWDKFGLGKLSLFKQHPKLEEVPKPLTFTHPDFFKYNETSKLSFANFFARMQ